MVRINHVYCSILLLLSLLTLVSCFRQELSLSVPTAQILEAPKEKVTVVEFTDLSSSFNACIYAGYFRKGDRVIDSDEKFQELLEYIFPPNDLENCKDFELPEVDFSTHQLLVGMAHASGCSQVFTPSVLFYEQTNDLEFKISVVEEGYCKPNVSKTYWILVPRVGGEVFFDVIRTIEP